MNTPTMAELLASSVRNRDIAEQQVQRIKQFLDREQEPGLEREKLLIDLSRYQADVAHWASYCLWYRLRCDREGAGAIPAMCGRGGVETLPARKPVRPAPPVVVPDPRLPRESDDDDEGDIPF